MKNVLKSLAKRVLISLKLTTAASASGAGIYKKNIDLRVTRLIISNEEIKDITK